jgi:xanthine/CO dehydrogenase XdhC/CoxF family maturation factor
MLVRADGSAAGRVSGGCVKGPVYELCREVWASEEPRSAHAQRHDAGTVPGRLIADEIVGGGKRAGTS